MTTVKTYDPNAITATDAALTHLRKRLKKEPGIGIRLSTDVAGCSGLKYVIDVITETADDDHVFQLSTDIVVAVQPQHWDFLKGVQLDFVKEGINEIFKFNNPNETGSCGCGESFTVD